MCDDLHTDDSALRLASAPKQRRGRPRARLRGLSRLVAPGVASLLIFSASAAWASAPAIHISGNRFVDAGGNTIRLLGVNAGPDLSDACVGPSWDAYRAGGVWGGPVDDRAIAAMTSWKINAARISLNEDCWLGINAVRRTSSSITRVSGRGAYRKYRSEVVSYVHRLNAAGLIVVIDLHWTAPGTTLAFDQWALPDRDHSPAFWRSVASTFRDNQSVVFDAFNEPFRAGMTWSCLRSGCTLPNACADCGVKVPFHCTNCKPAHGRYKTAGMQSLVKAIRATGARQPIMLPGRFYSNDLSSWLAYLPKDPLHQLAASFHAYQGLPCADAGCWDSQIAPIAAQVPVVTGEFGPNTWSQQSPLVEPCDVSFDNTYTAWADAHGVSYLAWSWYYDNLAVDNADRPKCTLNLIDGDWYSGTPRPGHGQAVHDHLAAISAAEGGGQVR